MPEEKDGKKYYSYDEIHELVKKMSEDIISRSESIDMIVAIATGGWFPARMMRTFLPYSGKLPLPLYSVGLLNYDANDNLLENPLILQELPGNLNLSDKIVLLIDEVADSGGTFAKARDYIISLQPKKLYTAVIHKKKKSTFNPDFVGEYAGNNWIVYPWDQK